MMKNFNILNETIGAVKIVGALFGILIIIIYAVITADQENRIDALEKTVYNKNEFKLQKNETQKMSPALAKQIQNIGEK